MSIDSEEYDENIEKTEAQCAQKSKTKQKIVSFPFPPLFPGVRLLIKSPLHFFTVKPNLHTSYINKIHLFSGIGNKKKLQPNTPTS